MSLSLPVWPHIFQRHTWR